MTVYELARQLGEELLKTEEVERVLAAKKAYEADEKAVGMITEYNTLQKQYREKMQNPDITSEEYNKLTEEIMAKGDIIQSYEITKELIEAENDFNQFMNSVFSIVTSTLSGEEENCGGGCDGGCCSSCGGGCH